jgi:hypothetical protein
MHANAISAINFFILVLSVASKLQWTNLALNKANTSKNSNGHPLTARYEFLPLLLLWGEGSGRGVTRHLPLT